MTTPSWVGYKNTTPADRKHCTTVALADVPPFCPARGRPDRNNGENQRAAGPWSTRVQLDSEEVAPLGQTGLAL